jgi:hypothetical protein
VVLLLLSDLLTLLISGVCLRLLLLSKRIWNYVVRTCIRFRVGGSGICGAFD